MSPSSSHPISLTEYETTETTIDAECLTTSTAGEPNGHINEECDLKNSKQCRSCKRCGSIGSNKSEIVTVQRNTEFNYDQSPTLIRRKCCASSSRIDAIVDLDDCPITIASRRPSMCSLRHGISTTSLNCRSSMRSICSKHGKEHSTRHQKRSQSHNRHERCHSRQHSHQHITNGESPHMSDHTISRNCCRHRRRISCSSHSGESIHYRKRIDSETSSFYGSESSIYEPNHADGGGGASSTNTVVLTPTKITIEHKDDTRVVEEYSNGITSANRKQYIASPTHWNFLTDDYDDDRHVNGKLNDAVQYDDYHRGGNEKKGALRKHYHRKSTPTHTRQRSDPDMSNDSIGTIIFHHKGESSGNCCDAYYQCNNDDIEMDNYTKQIDNFSTIQSEIDFDNNKIETHESILNNANSCEATHTQLNFHKNNISSMLEKPLNLLPDLRRYSKITNLESQNAPNLAPSYFGEPSTSHQAMANNKFISVNRIGSMSVSNSHNNQLITTTLTTSTTMLSNYTTVSTNEFELYDLTTPSAFQKPFGSISLTEQNDFEPYTHIRNRARSNASDRQNQSMDIVGTLSTNSYSLDHLDRITLSESNERVNYRNATSSESLVTMTDVRDGISTDSNQQTRRLSRLINIIRKRARNYIKKN